VNFDRWACSVSHWTGRPVAFVLAVGSMVAGLGIWWALGFAEGFLDAFNLAISIVTASMLFVLQGASNRDGAAIQAKLDELIRATSDARNEFRGLDRKAEKEIEALRDS
jgi:low affinity Fe/Cu permease